MFFQGLGYILKLGCIDSAMNVRICETPGCNSEASLQCPTCLKLGISGSFFCSQTCFKSYWSEHKVIHKVASEFSSIPYCIKAVGLVIMILFKFLLNCFLSICQKCAIILQIFLTIHLLCSSIH